VINVLARSLHFRGTSLAAPVAVSWLTARSLH
jgi:hypothetical protein